MKRLPWKYLAGLIDGEGCIDVLAHKNQEYSKFYMRPRVRIAMADNAKHLLEMCQNSHGGHLSARKFDNPNWQSATEWAIVGYKPVCMFLRNIVNHLILKKEQARLCLWMEEHVKGVGAEEAILKTLREELKLMKRDPHRLSVKAQEHILGMLQSD